MSQKILPANYDVIPFKSLGGLNATNTLECTAMVSDPFFMVNCDVQQLWVWQWKNVKPLIKNPPSKPLPAEVNLKAKALNVMPSYSGTFEFSVANGVHVSMDASSGNITTSQYTLTAPDGKQAPVFAGSTSQYFLY